MSAGNRAHIALAGFFIAAFYSMIYVRNDYTWTMPRTPQPSMGRTIEVVVDHNRHVFITPAENRRLQFCYVLSGIAGGAVLLVLLQRASRRA